MLDSGPLLLALLPPVNFSPLAAWLAFSSLALLPAQTARNVQLLGTFDPGEMSSGVWGYRDPVSGTELAFLLTMSGTYVLDCTTGTPVQRAFFPGPSSGWREAKCHGRYCYVVTEGGGGMQIIDLTNPLSPQLVGTHTVSGWNNSHTISVDAANGTLYCNGTNLGMLVFDVGTNPTQPPLVTTFTGFYVHDLHVQDGYAHMADIFGHRYQIADVSNLPAITIVGSALAPGRRFFHNVWATRDSDYAVGTSETSGGPMSVWDIRNKALPLLVAQIHPAPATAAIHLVIERERVVHIAYYTEGYVSIDVSVPAQPVVVASYDTYPGPSSGFNGAWGVWPRPDSDVVYISDMQTGLYVLRTKSAVERYGAATPGGSGATPRALGFGAAYLGNSAFRVQCASAAPSAPGAMLLGAARASLNLSGLAIHVDPVNSAILLPIVTDAAGGADIPLPVPNVQALNGNAIHAQFLVFDLGGPLNLSASTGLAIPLFAP